MNNASGQRTGSTRRVASVLLFISFVFITGQASAQIQNPVVYLFSGDLLRGDPGVKDPIADPAGLNGAHMSVLATVDSSAVPDVNGEYAIYRVVKTVTTISNAWIPSMNGTYTAISGNDLVTIRSAASGFPSVSLFALFEVGSSAFRGPLANVNGAVLSAWPAAPEFTTASVNFMNGLSITTGGVDRAYSFTNYSFTGQKIDLSYPDKFWNLLNQLGGSGSMGPRGDTGPVGAIGPVGPVGSVGATGAPGATGPTGPQGPIGIQGAQGVMGPIGPVGANGATGPQGIQGVPGLSLLGVSRSAIPAVLVTGNGTYTASIACPAGKTILGGGADSPNPDILLYSSRSINNGWQAKFRNTSNKAALVLISVEAVCANVATP